MSTWNYFVQLLPNPEKGRRCSFRKRIYRDINHEALPIILNFKGYGICLDKSVGLEKFKDFLLHPFNIKFYSHTHPAEENI